MMTEVETLERSPDAQIPSFGEMIWLFLKLGSIGFGGGIAMIVLMENEFVKRRKCLDIDEFLHGVALSQILGSFPVNTAFFIGYRLHGVLGGIFGSMVFLLPSFLAVLVLSWLYFSFQQIPSLQGVLSGLAPVVIGIILTAAWSMAQKAVGSPVAIAIVVGGCIGSLTQVNPVIILGLGGVIGLFLKMRSKPLQGKKKEPKIWKQHSIIGLPIIPNLPHQLAIAAPVSADAISLVLLAWTFFKVGFVFFGGGFVLIPVLKQLLIDNLHWLTQQEFIDGVAISQLTPGPIAVISTFAGFRVGGLMGATAATTGLFLPSIVLVFFLSMYYQKVRHLESVKHFLSGINPAVVGMIISAAINLAPSVFPLARPIHIAINIGLLGTTLFLIARLKWHPAISLAIGAGVGVLVSLIPNLA